MYNYINLTAQAQDNLKAIRYLYEINFKTHFFQIIRKKLRAIYKEALAVLKT